MLLEIMVRGEDIFSGCSILEPSYVDWMLLDGAQEVLAAQIAWQEEKAQMQVSDY
jgi:hypothetical protein